LKINFHKIQNNKEYHFELKNKRYSVKSVFTFEPKINKMLLCNLNFQGQVLTFCNRCGVEFTYKFDNSIKFLLHNGIYKGFDEDLDIIEIFNQLIDFEEILISEIELAISDYIKCNDCLNDSSINDSSINDSSENDNSVNFDEVDNF
jgi:uncharacterized metal-binding protein YceD (DUF177 family)